MFRQKLNLEALRLISQGDVLKRNCKIVELTGGDVAKWHLEEVSEMLQRMTYHDAGYTKCKATKTSINENELQEMKEQLWSMDILRNGNPAGYCRGRTEIILKILDEKGLKSKKVYKYGPTVGAYKVDDGYKLAQYLDHVVNQISVKTSEGLKDYIIDPMFSEKPLPKEAYLEMVRTDKGTNLKIEVKNQTHIDKIPPRIKGDECKYNVKIQKEYRKLLEESVDQEPDPWLAPHVFKSAKEALDYNKEEISRRVNEFSK